MTDLKTYLDSMEARFTGIKEQVESQVEHLRDQLETTPAAIKAKIAEGEAQLKELAAALGVVKAVKGSEDFLKKVEESIAQAAATAETKAETFVDKVKKDLGIN